MATPHNTAEKKDIASLVLMAGNPQRVKKMAEENLKNCRLVNSVRGMFAYTGTWHGRRITMMAHGMGAWAVRLWGFIPTNFSSSMMWKKSCVLAR